MEHEQASFVGVSSRRSACDRCKGQKLRCLRESGQERCHRCARADVACLTTPNTVPIRQFPRDGTGFRVRKRPRQGGQQHSNPATNHENTVRIGSASTPTYFENAQSPVVLPDGVFEPWDYSMDGLLFGDTLNENIDSPNIALTQMNAPMNSESHTSLAETLCLQERESCRRDVAQMSPGSAFLIKDHATQIDSSAIYDTPIQQLSTMNLKLVTLLSHIGQGSPTINLDTLIPPVDEPDSLSSAPVIEILDRTYEFINILSVLSGKDPKIPPLFHGSSSRRAALRQDAGISLARDENSVSSSPTSTADKEPDTNLDSTTLLLILTSYLYILRLYLIVFAHVREFLEELSKSDDPSLCPVPGINFSDFLVRKSTPKYSAYLIPDRDL